LITIVWFANTPSIDEAGIVGSGPQRHWYSVMRFAVPHALNPSATIPKAATVLILLLNMIAPAFIFSSSNVWTARRQTRPRLSCTFDTERPQSLMLLR